MTLADIGPTFAPRDGNVTVWSGNTFTGVNGATIPLSIDNYHPTA